MSLIAADVITVERSFIVVRRELKFRPCFKNPFSFPKKNRQHSGVQFYLRKPPRSGEWRWGTIKAARR